MAISSLHKMLSYLTHYEYYERTNEDKNYRQSKSRDDTYTWNLELH